MIAVNNYKYYTIKQLKRTRKAVVSEEYVYYILKNKSIQISLQAKTAL